MKDYKNTLNLPATDFPMKANLAQREPEILQYWQSINLYENLRFERKSHPKFSFLDGPPYANGHIHIGHALNKILKDIIVKTKTLSGFDAAFIPGWDCHGLPIELNVEKKIGKAGIDVSPQEFRRACREYAEEQIAIQREEFQRLGIIADWQNPYRTMDFTFEANIIRALAQIFANGYVVQGFKPVHWCFNCGSALAEAEVEYASKISPTIDVRFAVIDETDLWTRLSLSALGEGNISIPIWTTTPWTLPANQAVALHPDLFYCLVQIETTKGLERIVLAEALLDQVMARYGIKQHQILAVFSGHVLAGLQLQHPFNERTVPVVLGEHVTTDAGTGAVHTAPAHGQEDYLVGLKYHLPLTNPVDKKGIFLPGVPFVAGEHVFKANTVLMTLLAERGKLLVQDKIEHSYPHCWRHKTPLIFLATPQWFITLEQDLREQSIQAAEQVQWLPRWGMTNMSSMIANRPDWCISRQRNWGTPMTLFVHKKTGAFHPQSVQWMHKIADKVAVEGMEVWFSSEPEDWLGEEGKAYEKVNDVLDVWFDSGTAHFSVLEQRPELQFPADVVLEGSDQYRGWFQSLLLTSVGMQHTAPYKTVITHGFTVDEKGRKMSKSLGNVVAPEKIWNSMGADIVRLWVASTNYQVEVAISDEILKRLADAYRRIRNTARYFLANLFDFEPRTDLLAPEQLLSLDRWAMERGQQLQQHIQKAYDDFDYAAIYQLIHNFCIVDMGGFYLDVTKDRQYTTAKNSRARRSVQTAMFHLLEAMVRWLAPILSFTAEEIWRFIPGSRSASIFMAQWYDQLTVVDQNDVLASYGRGEYWQKIMRLREAVNKEIEKSRDEGEIGSSLEAEVELHFLNNSQLKPILEVLNKELRFALIVSKATLQTVADLSHVEIVNFESEDIGIKIIPSLQPKCARCWHHCADVGNNEEYSEICGRCVENVVGEGEARMFV